MVSKTVKIKLADGLHARPAAMIVQRANKFSSSIQIKKEDIVVDGKSVMGVLTLAAIEGSELEIMATGADEQEAIKAIEALFEKNFEPGDL